MRNQAAAVAEAERLLRHERKAYDEGYLNISRTEKKRRETLRRVPEHVHLGAMGTPRRL